MNKEALFCDGTEAYVSQPEPEVDEWIQLWFRTAKDDVDEVLMCIKDESFPMKKMISKGAFDYYCIDWQLDNEEFRYYFKILKSILFSWVLKYLNMAFASIWSFFT